jgi:hypothetical protein
MANDMDDMARVDHRLTTRQMADFVVNGFIRFDALVPLEVNERGIEECDTSKLNVSHRKV